MVNRVLQPQEIEVFYLLPALRRELAKGMKGQRKSQKEIARLLGVTEPAVSQYLSEKRAAGVQFPAKLAEEIKGAAQRITDEITMFSETQRLLQRCRNERLICQVHIALGSAPAHCEACFE